MHQALASDQVRKLAARTGYAQFQHPGPAEQKLAYVRAAPAFVCACTLYALYAYVNADAHT